MKDIEIIKEVLESVLFSIYNSASIEEVEFHRLLKLIQSLPITPKGK